MNTRVGLNYLHKMDNLDVLTKISRRLPNSGLSGWQAEVDSIIHHKMCDVSICDLANYVTLRTRQIVNFECNWSRISKSTVFNNYKAQTMTAK